MLCTTSGSLRCGPRSFHRMHPVNTVRCYVVNRIPPSGSSRKSPCPSPGRGAHCHRLNYKTAGAIIISFLESGGYAARRCHRAAESPPLYGFLALPHCVLIGEHFQHIAIRCGGRIKAGAERHRFPVAFCTPLSNILQRIPAFIERARK